MGFKCCMMVWGLKLAWRVRAVVDVLNESANVFLAISNLVFIAVFVVSLESLITDNPTTLLVLRVLGTFELSTATVAFVIAPKLYTLLVEGDLTLSVTETIRQQQRESISRRMRESDRSDASVSIEPAPPVDSASPSPDGSPRSSSVLAPPPEAKSVSVSL